MSGRKSTNKFKPYTSKYFRLFRVLPFGPEKRLKHNREAPETPPAVSQCLKTNQQSHASRLYRAKSKASVFCLLLLSVKNTSCSVRIMNRDGAYNPRTVEEVFRDYNGRRNGMIKALTTGKTLMFMSSTAFVIPVSVPFIDLFSDDGKSLEDWEVNLPAEEVPPELPEPVLGINFARNGMLEKDWLSLVAVHSDAWLMAVAFFFGARFGFDKADRKRLFNMVNDLPTVFEVVTDFLARKLSKEKYSVSNNSSNRSKSNSKVKSRRIRGSAHRKASAQRGRGGGRGE
ncbi:hypothetical protein YC2023_025716 [Brassica napus]